MDRAFSPRSRFSATSCLAVVVALGFLLSAPLGLAAARGATSPSTHPAVRQFFPSADTVYELASIGQHVLFANSFPNGSQDLVMFDPAHNSTQVVEAVNPTGTYLSGLVAAGGVFFVGWLNLSNGQTSYQQVTTGGTVTPLSKITPVPWTFPYGNSTALFATSGSYLVQLDPSTLTTVRNYSSKLPAGVQVNAVLPVGPRLYISGSEPASNGSASPFFGFLNRTSHVFHSVTKASTHFPGDLEGNFFSMLDLHGNIYLGGADTYHSLTTAAFHPVAGLFEAYNISAGKLTNLSGTLPHAAFGVYALDPWTGKVGLSLSDFVVNANGSSAITGGGWFTYKVGAATLGNDSSLWGPGYLANVFDVTSETGGYLTSGGESLPSGVSEVVSIKS